MDPGTRSVALALNPWLLRPTEWTAAAAAHLPANYLPRSVEGLAAARWDESDLVHLVVGPRQAGKTTLVWRHLTSVGPQVLFLSMEDPRLRSWCESPALFAADLKREFGSLQALFVDEVQRLPDAALFLKALIDLRPGFPVLVTGSAAYHLHGRTRESMAGRATRLTLLPFSLSEVSGDAKVRAPAARAALASEALDRHVVYGGYPAAWTSPDPARVLDRLVEAFLERDASDFFRIRRPDAMNRLLLLAARQTGSLVNVSEWAALCGVSRDTVEEYLQILEDSLLLERLPVYAAGRRAELTSASKIFFLDVGLRNGLLRDFRSPQERVDAGAMWEGWVFSELKKGLRPGDGLWYWRTRSGAEVDFVVTRPEGLEGYEVKAAALTRPALSRSARSFIEAYAPASFVVLNAALAHTGTIGPTRVEWRPFGWLGETGD
jgi:predicted AAA+ superfamily ATPase